MNRVLTSCPVCEGELVVTQLSCPSCDTTIGGAFSAGPFAGLSDEQLDFIETFVRCEGKFTRMEGELGLSYPTIRGRLHDIIRALNYEVGVGEQEPPSKSERLAVLASLEKGEMSAAEAIDRLQGGEPE